MTTLRTLKDRAAVLLLAQFTIQRGLSVLDKVPQRGRDTSEVTKDRKHYNERHIDQGNIFIRQLMSSK